MFVCILIIPIIEFCNMCMIHDYVVDVDGLVIFFIKCIIESKYRPIIDIYACFVITIKIS